MQHLKLAVAAVVIILIPACMCRMLPIHEGDQASPPAPCCTPDQWETSFALLASPSFITGYGSISYDYTNQLMALNQTIVSADGKTMGQRYLMDGTAQKVYFVDVNTKKCTVSSYQGIKQLCVPDYYNYTTIVALGDASEHFNGLVFQSIDQGFVSFVMTKNQCAFASMTYSSKDSMGIQSFYNFTLGIKDRSVFKVPPECTSAAEQDMIRLPRSVRSDMPCALFGSCWLLSGGMQH